MCLNVYISKYMCVYICIYVYTYIFICVCVCVSVNDVQIQFYLCDIQKQVRLRSGDRPSGRWEGPWRRFQKGLAMGLWVHVFCNNQTIDTLMISALFCRLLHLIFFNL